MADYKCINFVDCSKAKNKAKIDIPAGGEPVCPECGMSLEEHPDYSSASASASPSGSRKKRVAAIALGLAVVVAGGGYAFLSRPSVVTLRPLPASASVSATAPVATAPAGGSSSTESAPGAASNPAGSASATQAPTAAGKSDGMLAQEKTAQINCEDATKAKRSDADKLCRRATAITLMNSGVHAAVSGKLENAEKDYLAAKDKDADIPELYFNLAVLKARLGKSSEVIDNLTLAEMKGFKQFSAIKAEPSLQKLKSDPQFKSKIEAFEAKSP